MISLLCVGCVFLLNNNIFTFHDLIGNRHCLTYYNKILYVRGGEGYCELLVNFADFMFIVHVILLLPVHS